MSKKKKCEKVCVTKIVAYLSTMNNKQTPGNMKQEVYVMQYGEGLIQEMPNGYCNWFFRPTDKRGNISNAQARLKAGKTVNKHSALTNIEAASRHAGFFGVTNKAWNND